MKKKIKQNKQCKACLNYGGKDLYDIDKCGLTGRSCVVERKGKGLKLWITSLWGNNYCGEEGRFYKDEQSDIT